MLHEAVRDHYSDLRLKISSDDPRILYWPWEALRDPQVGVLAHTCQIERQLNNILDPHPLSEQLPQDRVNILLVTARPYKHDVGLRSISRPLVEQIEELKLPASVTVLRPPTFANLRQHLSEHPHQYHILHFDGHGSYGGKTSHQDPNLLQGAQGQLIFEDEDGQPNPQSSEVLSQLLRQYELPLVVLNACQSGMVDDYAEDAFASVAAGLLKSGVRGVVAMAYSLYVTGAQEFLPAFYRRLFETGRLADATRAGRQQMLAQPKRVCARGRYDLGDWLVPVLYEQEPFDVSFTQPSAVAEQETDQPLLPEDARDDENPYGFIGRDSALQQIERALLRKPPAILIHGLGGIGKTTLARGTAEWLATTGGLGQGCLWIPFQEVRNAEYVINHMVGALFGTNALAAPLDAKIDALLKVFREHKFLLVWDNFEVVCGVPGSSLQPALSVEDQQRLQAFLKGLRGGPTKVLITSRNDEQWLDPTTCFRLSLGGLREEERWEYCETILDDLGLKNKVDRGHQRWKELIDLLDGHPLAMRVLLPKLANSTPAQLIDGITTNLTAFVGQDQESAKLFAVLELDRLGLPAELQPLLIPLALHERFVDSQSLHMIAQRADSTLTEQQAAGLLQVMAGAGILRDRDNGIYEMHPVLSRFLRLTVLETTDEERAQPWRKAFAEVMARAADSVVAKELHEQRPVFHLHGENFQSALAEAERRELNDEIAMLLQSIAAFAQHNRQFEMAQALFEQLAENSGRQNQEDLQASSYHQLGRIAEEQRDFAAAEQWYRKSLEIKERQGNEHGAASSYHQLGRVAQEQRDWISAGNWYVQALQIYVPIDEHNAGIAARSFGRNYQSADADTQPKLKALWEQAGLGEFPEPADDDTTTSADEEA